VHSVGGGVGIAATQIAKRIGARVIGTASAAKHEALQKLGVDHCIDYTKEDFEARVKELTLGRGVELALDAVGADSFRKSYRALAPTGRLGMFGLSAAATGKRRSLLRSIGPALKTYRLRFGAIQLMNENKGVFGVNLGHLWEEMDRLGGWFEELMRWHLEGAIQPIIAARFPLDRAAEAHHYIQDRKNLGKVVLVP
jgi:NADPH:quinone reductase-like Zn-dependent oxidoreductase